MSSTEQTVALPLRSHTILGVCEAIGEDFGFNPLALRIALGAIVVVSVKWAIIAYLALGALVLASRMLFPSKTIVVESATDSAPAANSNVEERLAA